MAALTANEILKPFYSGEMMGKERYHMIIRKIENNEPFKINKGGLEMLKFKEEVSLFTMRLRRKLSLFTLGFKETRQRTHPNTANTDKIIVLYVT